jgi:quercetin dioxygenase-like cupin family protein
MHPSRRPFLSATSASFAIPAICGGSAEAQLTKEQEGRLVIIRSASRVSRPGPPGHFTGTVQINRIVERPYWPSRTASSCVAFEPRGRTWWHTHPHGQTLLITAGAGWIQCDGERLQEVQPGDVIWIPADVKHWHGAKSNTPMTHIAIQEQDDRGHDTYWKEEVSDKEYPK